MVKPNECLVYAIVAVALTLPPTTALAQASADDANKSNNPLNPAPGLNAQDSYVAKLYGSDKHTNDLLLRGTLPVLPSEHMPAPQIFRLTVPVSTRPDSSGSGYTTGLGDLNLFDIFLLKKTEGGIELGAGPLITAPTASKDELGAGKWQAGLAGVAIHPSPGGLLGGLLQWQHSFAGDSDRATVNTLTLQPLWIHNLREGWYVRSTGIWTFDLAGSNYYIPIGFGAGKIWKTSDGTLYNLFAEPQWTVAHDGDGLPKFSVFFGLNVTLGGK